MTTPRGCLKSITTAFKRFARNGDVEGLRAYLRSDAFLTAFGGLDPERRQSAMRAYTRAEALCEAKAPHLGVPRMGPLRPPSDRSSASQAKAHSRQARAEGQLE